MIFLKRTVGTKALRSESIMSVQDIAVQLQALLNVKDSNKVQLKQAIFQCLLLLNILTSNHLDFTYLLEDRERLVVRRFKFEDPRIEQIQDLENDLMKYFREDLHRRLLSTDFKKKIDGLEMLQKALPSIGKEIVEVLDIPLQLK
ncbi:protein MOR1-like [Humulus lupulus]|uniref:protein MOR1-like n=1 Tax=Humulus lupulus TaxID=3486 RepID=UPI002B40B53A|nr:protein MOR1-like [Humulus lupulus]